MSANTASPSAPTTSDREALRSRLHGMWSSVAGAWGANAAFVDQRAAAVSRRLLELSVLHPGARVLELACGVGGTGLQAAPRVAPGGEVIQSDIAPAMTEIAAERARSRGLENVRTRVLDLESIAEPDHVFDVVLCREGLMLVPDPARALAEIRRVLRPDGRVALSVWGPPAENPWLALVFEALSEQLGMPMPPPGLPQPFSLHDADRLAALLSEAGFRDVCVEDLSTPYLAASAEEWWQRTAALAGPLAQKLAALPEDASRSLGARAAEAIAPYETPAGLEIPGLSLIASAARPLGGVGA